MTSDGIAGVALGTISLLVTLWIAARQRKDSAVLGDLHTKVLRLQSAVYLRANLRQHMGGPILDITNTGLQPIKDVEVTALIAENKHDVTIRTHPDKYPWTTEGLKPQQTFSVRVQSSQPLIAIVSFKDSDGTPGREEIRTPHLT